jgi:hypothetical protein
MRLGSSIIRCYDIDMTRADIDANLKQVISLGTPVEVFDPSTNQVYYLLSAEQYQMLAKVAAEDIDPRHSYPLIGQVMAEDDANDPLLETYQ